MILITLLLVVSNTFSVYARLDDCEEGWMPYKDEKCIQVFPSNVGSFEKTEKFCAEQEKADDKRSRIFTVTTFEEQEFVADLLFKKRNDIVDDIWLGAQYDEGSTDFRWRTDFGRGVELLDDLNEKNDNYANWQEGEPENDQKHKNHCVEMIGSVKAQEKGKWRATLCSKTNIAVCEKPQVWSASKQQAELLKIQKQNEKIIKSLLPYDFIYVQLPNEKAPEDIWPSYSHYGWEDVSNAYTGAWNIAVKVWKRIYPVEVDIYVPTPN